MRTMWGERRTERRSESRTPPWLSVSDRTVKMLEPAHTAQIEHIHDLRMQNHRAARTPGSMCVCGVCMCVCAWRSGGSPPYSLVPSSETIPRPSALFCLSKAFKSKTLQTLRRIRRQPSKQNHSDSFNAAVSNLFQAADRFIVGQYFNRPAKVSVTFLFLKLSVSLNFRE